MNGDPHSMYRPSLRNTAFKELKTTDVEENRWGSKILPDEIWKGQPKKEKLLTQQKQYVIGIVCIYNKTSQQMNWKVKTRKFKNF